MTQTTEQTAPEELTALIQELQLLRHVRDQADLAIKEMNAQIAPLLHERARYTDASGVAWAASVVRKEDIVVDLERLREINEDLYIDATKRVLDRPAFEHLVRSGQIPTEIAVEVATFKQQNPYVLFKKEATSDE